MRPSGICMYAYVLTCKAILLRNVVRSVEWFIDPMFVSDTNQNWLSI